MTGQKLRSGQVQEVDSRNATEMDDLPLSCSVDQSDELRIHEDPRHTTILGSHHPYQLHRNLRVR